MRSTTDPARFVAAARGLVGVVLVSQPDRVIDLVGLGSHRERIRWAVRTLGVRHMVESATLTVRPSRGAHELVAGADTVHAVSMVALAAASSRDRRLATVAAGLACVMCAATILTGGRGIRRGSS